MLAQSNKSRLSESRAPGRKPRPSDNGVSEPAIPAALYGGGVPTNELSAEPMQHEELRRARAFGDFLDRYEWHHWATLTPSSVDCSPLTLTREFCNGFVRRVAWAARGPLGWFYSLERGGAGVYHLHAIISGTEHVSTRVVQSAWKIGHSRIERFDALQGACWYLSKGLGHEQLQLETWDMSTRLGARIETRGQRARCPDDNHRDESSRVSP